MVGMVLGATFKLLKEKSTDGKAVQNVDVK